MPTSEVKVPDIGDFKNIPVIEIHVKEGDAVNADDPVVTLESDKATMDIPAPASGTVEAVLIKLGDRVSEGSPILRLRGNEEGAMSQPPSLLSQQEPPPAAQPTPSPAPVTAAPATAPQAASASATSALPDFSGVHASPSVRRVARELDVDLNKLKGTGEKGRITKEDVLAFLRGPSAAAAPAAAASTGSGIPEIPAQDFSKFGPIETKPMSRIKRAVRPASCIAPGSTFRTSPSRTKPTSPSSRLSQGAGHRRQGQRLPRHLAGLPAQGKRLVPAAIPEFNSSLSPEKTR